MAIQKRFIHFKKFSDFNSKKLSANEANTQYTVGVSGEVQDGEPDILYQSYCWIKDTGNQWTHGNLYKSVNWSILKLINFSIGNISYNAEEGMTWEEWLNSKYNTDGWTKSGNIPVKFDPNYYFIDVRTTEIIIPNFNYLLLGGGGSND